MNRPQDVTGFRLSRKLVAVVRTLARREGRTLKAQTERLINLGLQKEA